MSIADPLLTVQGISKAFAGRRVVTDLALEVRAGEIVGLVGANGGGKTTTLRILAGLVTPDTGHGSVLGLDLRLKARQIRARAGYMPQGKSFYPSLTVRENLRFRAAAFCVPNAKQAVSQLVDTYGLRRFEDTRAESLSGGWARLLQLAGALIHSPPLLYLDEPTAGLDIANRHWVWEHIGALARSGVAVILSTHDLVEAERCGRLTLLAEGVTLASGTPAEVIAGASAATLEAATLALLQRQRSSADSWQRIAS